MAHNNGIIMVDTTSGIRIKQDISPVLGVGSYNLTVLHRSGNVKQWNICKPVKDTRMVTDVVSGSHSATSFDYNTHNIPDSAGELSRESVSFGGQVAGELWKCYGMKIPVVSSIYANDIHTAAVAMASDSAKNWPADLPTSAYPARQLDFNYYNHNILTPSFQYVITDSYTDRDAKATLTMNDGEATAYRFGIKNILALFGQSYLGSWKPAVAYKTAGGSYYIDLYNGTDTRDTDWIEWDLPQSRIANNTNVSAVFCLVNSSLAKTILLPNLSGNANPRTFYAHNSGSPSAFSCQAFNDGKLGYSASGTYMSIYTMEGSWAMYTSGSARLRVPIYNDANTAQTFNYALLRPYVDDVSYSYYTIYTEGGTTPQTGTVSIPAGGHITIDIQMNNLISSGFETKYVDLYYNGNNITTGTAELRLLYATSGQGTFINYYG